MPGPALAIGAIGVGLQVASMLQGASARRRAGRAARHVARLNAINDEMSEVEEISRLRYMHRRERGATMARMAAAGITLQGSPMDYLEEMDSVRDREIDWIRTSGRSRRRAIIAEGEAAARGANIQARSQTMSAIGTGLAGFGQMAQSQGWWTS